MEPKMTKIRVVELLDVPTALGPEQADPVGNAVLRALQTGEVELSFVGVEGMTTAFTNALLLQIFESYRIDELRGRLHLLANSRLHREIILRSMTALKELKSSP